MRRSRQEKMAIKGKEKAGADRGTKRDDQFLFFEEKIKNRQWQCKRFTNWKMLPDSIRSWSRFWNLHSTTLQTKSQIYWLHCWQAAWTVWISGWLTEQIGGSCNSRVHSNYTLCLNPILPFYIIKSKGSLTIFSDLQTEDFVKKWCNIVEWLDKLVSHSLRWGELCRATPGELLLF